MAARDLRKLLATAPTRPFSDRLVRCIPLLTFQTVSPPSYLFTSSSVNRCNSAGVNTLYMAEDRVHAPDSLAILGKAGAVLERWP
jgi:hypothetical protein